MWIDDFTLIRKPDGRSNDSALGEVSAVSNASLRNSASVVVLLCQLNREGDGVNPSCPTCAETGQSEQDANAVMMLWPQGPEGHGIPVENKIIFAKLAKNRSRRQRDGRLKISFNGARERCALCFGRLYETNHCCEFVGKLPEGWPEKAPKTNGEMLGWLIEQRVSNWLPGFLRCGSDDPTPGPRPLCPQEDRKPTPESLVLKAVLKYLTPLPAGQGHPGTTWAWMLDGWQDRRWSSLSGSAPWPGRCVRSPHWRSPADPCRVQGRQGTLTDAQRAGASEIAWGQPTSCPQRHGRVCGP